uniref:Uncharacterized protein n=1 Tax=Anguilla anguilla TaxID=7936 RepID=A0A0E9QG42_ANGAN
MLDIFQPQSPDLGRNLGIGFEVMSIFWLHHTWMYIYLRCIQMQTNTASWLLAAS